MGATGWILPGRDHRAAVAYFGKVIRSQLPVAQEVCVYRLVQAHGGKHPIVFYLDDPVSRVDSKRKLQQRIAQDGQLYVVTYKPTVEELSRLGNLTTVKTMVTPTGFAPFRGPSLGPREINNRWWFIEFWIARGCRKRGWARTNLADLPGTRG